jgi:GntR family transcriptional regulator
MFALDPSDPTPIYAQLERAIRVAIATGRLGKGDRLPTVRQLAVDLRINANTVAKVYSELERAGVLETRRGVGTFVGMTPASPSSEHERRRHVTAFLDRFLAEAATMGLSLDDLIHALKQQQHQRRQHHASRHAD